MDRPEPKPVYDMDECVTYLEVQDKVEQDTYHDFCRTHFQKCLGWNPGQHTVFELSQEAFENSRDYYDSQEPDEPDEEDKLYLVVYEKLLDEFGDQEARKDYSDCLNLEYYW